MASTTAPKYFQSLTVSDGTKYGFISIPAAKGKPTLLFLHGYPSSSYHWHNQISQCIDGGYGAIIPDLLGYGDTDRPEEISKYDHTVMSGHVMEILDHEKHPVVVAVAHDWGCNLLATAVRMFPDRFSQLVFLAVGYFPGQASLQDIEALDAQAIEFIGRPVAGYWLFHNKPEAASIIESAPPLSLASLLYPEDPRLWADDLCPPGKMEEWITKKKTGNLAPWLTQSDMETHDKIMKAGGYTGPLNWYKQAMAGVTHASELKINPQYETTKIKIPTLFVGCENDMICVPAIHSGQMKDFFDDLTVKSLATGHWIMLEKPKEFWDTVEGWLQAKTKTA